MTTEAAIDLSNEETSVAVLSLQLKKLRWHNGSAIDLSNVNPARGQRGTEVNNAETHLSTYKVKRQPSGRKQLF